MRLLEDSVLVGRFAWFYYRAPQELAWRQTGFAAADNKMPVRDRTAYAWKRATTL